MLTKLASRPKLILILLIRLMKIMLIELKELILVT